MRADEGPEEEAFEIGILGLQQQPPELIPAGGGDLTLREQGRHQLSQLHEAPGAIEAGGSKTLQSLMEALAIETEGWRKGGGQ